MGARVHVGRIGVPTTARDELRSARPTSQFVCLPHDDRLKQGFVFRHMSAGEAIGKGYPPRLVARMAKVRKLMTTGLRGRIKDGRN